MKSYTYQLVLKTGTTVTQSFREPATVGGLYKIEINGSEISVKCIDALTMKEIEPITKGDWIAIGGLAIVAAIAIGAAWYSISVQIGVKPNADVIAASRQVIDPANPNEKIVVSNSEYAMFKGCGADDYQLYRVFGEDGVQRAIICGGSSVRAPWTAQKAPTLRFKRN